MNKSKYTFSAIAFSLICLMSFSNSFAQTRDQPQIEPGYEVVLHILIGSNDSNGNKKVPSKLSDVLRKLKENASFEHYNLFSVFLGRIGDSGGSSQRLFLKGLAKDKDSFAVIQWKLDQLRSLPESSGKNYIEFRDFEFQANLPVQRTITDDNFQKRVIENGESIRLTLGRFNLPENEPTLIGTLEAPFNEETLFFVLTVKPYK